MILHCSYSTEYFLTDCPIVFSVWNFNIPRYKSFVLKKDYLSSYTTYSYKFLSQDFYHLSDTFYIN